MRRYGSLIDIILSDKNYKEISHSAQMVIINANAYDI